MAAPCCDNCVYSIVDPQVWRRLIWLDEPILPRCANHPQWPGRLHEVPGVACGNYRPRPVLPHGDAVRMIPLGDGFYAYVDAADYEELSRYTWHYCNGYAARRQGTKWVLMHRQITQAPDDRVVDHYDGNRANDCRLNLRTCKPEENQRNQRKRHGSRSRFKGVFYSKAHRKWFAQCQLRGKKHFLGYFDSEIEAARAYDRMAVEFYGEFARLNLPEEWPPERRAEVYAQSPRRTRSPRATTRKPKPSAAHTRRGESSFARPPRAKPPAHRPRSRTTKRPTQTPRKKSRRKPTKRPKSRRQR